MLALNASIKSRRIANGEDSALGGLLDCQADAEASMVARIVVLGIPSQVPG